MQNKGKQAVLPYQSLIDSSVRKIDEENYETVRVGIADPIRTRRRRIMVDASGREREWTSADLRTLVKASTRFYDGHQLMRIRGPEPLQSVQQELRGDLERLANPESWLRKNYVYVDDWQRIVEDISWLEKKLTA